jgi:signal transduction histidine kinase/ligand-binding sensor domain-containing protein/DNA-binding response OmpR family regulator
MFVRRTRFSTRLCARAPQFERTRTLLQFALTAALLAPQSLVAQRTPPPLVTARGQALQHQLLRTALHPWPEGMIGVSRGEFVRQRWTMDDGLPVNSVRALLQDRAGYLWVGTFDGLARFDGVHFTVYNTSNTPALPSNRVTELREDASGHLWLLLERGELVRVQRGQFTHFDSTRGLTEPITAWGMDGDGLLWVGTSRGFGVVEGDRVHWLTRFSRPEVVKSFAGRRRRIMWVGTTQARLYRVEQDKVTHVDLPGGDLAITVDPLLAVGDSALWMIYDKHVWRFGEARPRGYIGRSSTLVADPHTGVPYAISDRFVFRVDADTVVPMDRRTGTTFTSSVMLMDDAGNLYAASGSEVRRNGQLLVDLAPPAAERSGSYAITSILRDREGSIWAGTVAEGLHRLKPATFVAWGTPEGLESKNVNTVYETRDGAIWMGALEASRLVGTRIEPVRALAGMKHFVRTVLQDRQGRVWVGTGVGVHECTEDGTRCSRSLAVSETAVLHEDPRGIIWAGGVNGLHQFDGTRWTTVRAPFSHVRNMVSTRDGALWIATAGSGLIRHDGRTFRAITTKDELPFDHLRGMYEDRDGWLWVGTEGRGLARLDPREWQTPEARGRIVSIRARDGLFDDVIHAILADDADRLWMSSNRGIFRVRRDELLDVAAGRTAHLHSTSFTEHDGMRSREANGVSQPAAFRARDGRLWFATQDGAVVVDPRPRPANPPAVVIEQITAGGRVIPVGDAPLRLGTDQRTLQLQYTALSLLSPRNVQFRYRLEPYDSTWVEAGTRRTAFYTKVPPGRYTFRVVTSNDDGAWNETEASVSLELVPFFWETTPFRLLLLLAGLLAGTAALRWRLRSIAATTSRLAQLVEERTADLREQQEQLRHQAARLQEIDEAKTRFFANVSHELRTPLTLTVGPLEVLRERLPAVAPVVHRIQFTRTIDLALRNAQRLLALVDQILDVSKLEAGRMPLRAQEQDLVVFTRGVTSAFESLCEGRGITLTLTSGVVELAVWFDSDAMEKILANLIGNACKFTPDGGHVHVHLNTSAEEAESCARRFAVVSVSDTGPGIPLSQHPLIFERFQQVDESNGRAASGTGIGLSLVKELVELHHGQVTVGATGTSLEPAGAVFTVRLPLGSEHLTPEERVPTSRHAVGDVPRLVAASAHSERAETYPAPSEVDGGDIPTLLIIDDSAELRRFMREQFTNRFRVFESDNGLDGMAIAHHLIPDLIIADVMMPGADGVALCHALRSSPETDFIPILLLTARTGTDERVEGFEAGADEYMAKPFSMRELAARAENLLRSRRRLRERWSAPRERSDVAPPALVVTSHSPRVALGAAAEEVEFLQRLSTIVEQYLGDPEFGVTELAAAMAMDRTSLFRRCRDLLAEPPSDLLRRARLDRGARLLQQSDETIAAIAYTVGFNSVSYFCRVFRDAQGVTPSHFRATHRAEEIGSPSLAGATD